MITTNPKKHHCMPIVAQLPDLSGCHLQEKDTTMITCERDNPNVEIDGNGDYQGINRRGERSGAQ